MGIMSWVNKDERLFEVFQCNVWICLSILYVKTQTQGQTGISFRVSQHQHWDCTAPWTLTSLLEQRIPLKGMEMLICITCALSTLRKHLLPSQWLDFFCSEPSVSGMWNMFVSTKDFTRRGSGCSYSKTQVWMNSAKYVKEMHSPFIMRKWKWIKKTS